MPWINWCTTSRAVRMLLPAYLPETPFVGSSPCDESAYKLGPWPPKVAFLVARENLVFRPAKTRRVDSKSQMSQSEKVSLYTKVTQGDDDGINVQSVSCSTGPNQLCRTNE